MNDDEWLVLIRAAVPLRPEPIKMFTYRNKSWPSWSRPVVLASEDGVEYVVKCHSVGADRAKAMQTEQVVSRLGVAMGAPVGSVELVDVPQALIDMNRPHLDHITAGISHGSRRIPNASERAWLEHVNVPENRERFAKIAVLYGWALARDHQLIYEMASPRLVHSVDHGWFFANGPNWSATTLAGNTAVALEPQIVAACNFTDDELRPAFTALRGVSPEMIAEATARPPDAWGITEADRLNVAKYLYVRQENMIALAPN